MKRSLLVIILSLGLCHPALAQEPIRLTLDEAIARGMQASHRLAELTARQDAARAVAEQRDAAGQPQLAALASYTRINHNEEFGVPDPVVGRRVILSRPAEHHALAHRPAVAHLHRGPY